MTGHTAKGVPYALPTDALIDYPTASLELANIIADAPWTAIPDGSFGSGNFRNFPSSPGYACAYCKDVQGVVRMRGLVQWVQGVTPQGQSLFQLPAAYRPPSPITPLLTTRMGVDTAKHGSVRIDISATGMMSIGEFEFANDTGVYTNVWFSLFPLQWMTT